MKHTYKRGHFSPAVRSPHEIAAAEARVASAKQLFEEAMEAEVAKRQLTKPWGYDKGWYPVANYFEWHDYPGCYMKGPCFIRTKDGRELYIPWPNAGNFRPARWDSGIPDTQVAQIRYLYEDEDEPGPTRPDWIVPEPKGGWEGQA